MGFSEEDKWALKAAGKSSNSEVPVRGRREGLKSAGRASKAGGRSLEAHE